MSYDFSAFQQKADKTIQFLRDDIGTLRTGRASSQMLDIVSVEAYGTRMKVNEVANVSVPDPTLLVVSPWDKSLLSVIEKGIASAGINLHPVVDGDIIRIMVPALTEERRRDMVKLLHQKIQSGLVLLRNVRSDTRKEVEKEKGEPGVSEDTIKNDLEQLDHKTKVYEEQVAKMSTDKEKELMTV